MLGFLLVSHQKAGFFLVSRPPTYTYTDSSETPSEGISKDIPTDMPKTTAMTFPQAPPPSPHPPKTSPQPQRHSQRTLKGTHARRHLQRLFPGPRQVQLVAFDRNCEDSLLKICCHSFQEASPKSWPKDHQNNQRHPRRTSPWRPLSRELANTSPTTSPKTTAKTFPRHPKDITQQEQNIPKTPRKTSPDRKPTETTSKDIRKAMPIRKDVS